MDMELVFCSLMGRANDEPDAVYAYAADQVEVSADGRIYRFRLRNGVKFHDGTPITAADVRVLAVDPEGKRPPQHRDAIARHGGRRSRRRPHRGGPFHPTRARSAPLTAANLPILSKAYYSTHTFDETSLEPPLGSGPYKVGKFEQGRFPGVRTRQGLVGRGFRRSIAASTTSMCCATTTTATATSPSRASPARATCSGRSSPSRVWAQRYDFPAVRDGRVKRETIPDERLSGAQGWMINTRRDRFRGRDPRSAGAARSTSSGSTRTRCSTAIRGPIPTSNLDMMAATSPRPKRLAAARPL